VELPPRDEKPRLRVALAPEAAQLLAALEPEDALPNAIAFYAGLRRSEIHRLECPEVLAGEGIDRRLLVARSKNEAGTERRPPIAEPLQAAAWNRQGHPRAGRLLERSVMSSKLAERATKAWTRAGLTRITLHESATPTRRC
jgi:integrase